MLQKHKSLSRLEEERKLSLSLCLSVFSPPPRRQKEEFKAHRRRRRIKKKKFTLKQNKLSTRLLLFGSHHHVQQQQQKTRSGERRRGRPRAIHQRRGDRCPSVRIVFFRSYSFSLTYVKFLSFFLSFFQFVRIRRPHTERPVLRSVC